MVLDFRNDTNCFKVRMLVDKWDKLGGMRKVNGQSYPKELMNVKWSIEKRNRSKEVVYNDMSSIID